MLALVTYDDDTKYVCKSVKRAYELIKEEILGMDEDDLESWDYESAEEHRQNMLWELEDSYKENNGTYFDVCEFCSCEEVAEWD